jgi:perosamine synthetase
MQNYYKILEDKYSKFCGAKYGVSCNTGTAALHLALLAIGVGKGDEVIIPDFTMAACGFAVSYTGAKPVFVDCDDSLCMDWKLIEKKITKKTKAIMVVHIYGVLCNMKEILKIAKKHKLKVIEDACEVQGAVYKSKADITCYSFYENKIIHAEEGGMCTTDNKQYADRMNYLKNMAFGD